MLNMCISLTNLQGKFHRCNSNNKAVSQRIDLLEGSCNMNGILQALK